MSEGIVKLQAPEGTTQVSVEQQIFNVASDGTVSVPFPFVPKLRELGFRFAAARVQLVGGGSVSPEEQAVLLREASDAQAASQRQEPIAQ